MRESTLESQHRRLPPSIYRMTLSGFFKPFFPSGFNLWWEAEGKHVKSWAFGEVLCVGE